MRPAVGELCRCAVPSTFGAQAANTASAVSAAAALLLLVASFVTGRFGGQTIPGAETMNMTDQGTALITNERVMFQGSLRTHEWKFSKMMGMSHLPGGITTFAMTSAGKPAGFGYGDDVAPLVQFRLEFAAALALGTLDRFRGELMVEKDKHEAEKPIPPAPLTSAG